MTTIYYHHSYLIVLYIKATSVISPTSLKCWLLTLFNYIITNAYRYNNPVSQKVTTSDLARKNGRQVDATGFILDLIETRFGEVYNDKFIKDLKETIRKISDSTDSFSFADLENDFYYAITNKDIKRFEDIKFDDYYYTEYLNEKLENGEYLKTKK